MNKEPFISVVIPTFNRVKFIEPVIKILIEEKKQYPRMEIIIIDGGSGDGTAEILKKYSDGLAYWVSERDKGAADAFTKGVLAARGDYVRHFADDDQWIPGTMRIMADYLAQHSEIDILGAKAESFAMDKEGNLKPFPIPVTSGDFIFKDYLEPERKGVIITETCFFKRTLFSEIGYWNLRYGIACDVDFMIRALKRKKKVRCIDILIVKKIWHVESCIWKAPESFRKNYCRSILKHAGFFPAIRYAWKYMLPDYLNGPKLRDNYLIKFVRRVHGRLIRAK